MRILSPFAAWVWPLDRAPDDAFATGALGRGLALDPLEGLLLAPLEGVVTVLGPSAHAAVLRHASGLEVLVHVGIDTVALNGEGFEALAAVGQTVAVGQPLIRFDLDAVARRAPSLVSPLVVVEPAGFDLFFADVERVVAAGQPVITARRRAATLAHPSSQARPGLSGEVVIGLAEGVHARPAARLTALARSHAVRGRIIRTDGASADLHSLTSLMSLGLARGDEVRLEVEGAEAAQALAGLTDLLTATDQARSPVIEPPRRTGPEGAVGGVIAAQGLALGAAWLWSGATILPPPAEGPPEAEAARLARALAHVEAELDADLRRSPPALAGVLAAHRALLNDQALVDPARSGVLAGMSAGSAWSETLAAMASRFQASGDERLAARTADLADVRDRVLRALGGAAAEPPAPPPGAVILARDLLPSDLVRFSETAPAGVALAEGSPGAHVALMAAALGLPMLTGLGLAVLALTPGAPLALDAEAGWLLTSPSEAVVSDLRARMRAAAASTDSARAAARLPASSRDGVAFVVLGNLASVAEAELAVRNGAEGCGLLRTELLFAARAQAPGAQAQAEAYAEIAARLEGRPCVVRLLDPAPDKPLAWAAGGFEANPALGLRGVRLALARPDLLRDQLAALAALDSHHQVSVLVPMVSDLAELRAIRVALQSACEAAGRAPLPLGVMIETPASAFIADRLADEADFLSIGGNDLAAYVAARDRTATDAAEVIDGLSPAALRACAMVLRAGGDAGVPVSICGALAADPVALPVLVGLGARRVSCPPATIPAVKARLRGLDLAGCEALAHQALKADSAAETRRLSQSAYPIDEGAA